MNVFEQILDLVRRPKRTGQIGDIGGGGIFSGADPNNPNIMHYTGQDSAPVRQQPRIDTSEVPQPQFSPVDFTRKVQAPTPYVQSSDEAEPTFAPIEPRRTPNANMAISPGPPEPDLMPRVKANDAVDESQLIAPKDTFARNTSLNLAGNEPRFEPVQLDRMPIEARQAQQRNTKPVYRDTGNPREDTARYEQDLRNWQNPIHHGNRFVAGLKTGARAAGEMARAGGGLPQIAGAFLGGNVYGDVQPNIVERNWRDDEAAKAGQRRAAFDAIETKNLQRDKLKGEIGETAARTNEILNPRPKPEQNEIVKVRGQGSFLVNKQTGERRKLDIPNEVDPEEWDTQKGEDGKYFWKNKRTQELKPMTYGGKQVQDTMVTMKLPTGQKVRVSPSVAVNAIAQGGRSVANIQNQQSWRQYETERRGVAEENRRVEKEYAEAQKAAAEFNKLHDKVDEMRAAYDSIPNPISQKDREAKEYYGGEVNRLHKQMDAMHDRLMERYKGTNYIQYSDEERFVEGTRPEPKADPDPPELSFSEGPTVVDEGDDAPAPSRPTSAPRGRRSSGPTGNDNAVTTKSKYAETKKKYGM